MPWFSEGKRKKYHNYPGVFYPVVMDAVDVDVLSVLQSVTYLHRLQGLVNFSTSLHAMILQM